MRIKKEVEDTEGCDRIDLIIKFDNNTASAVKSKADVNQSCASNHWELQTEYVCAALTFICSSKISILSDELASAGRVLTASDFNILCVQKVVIWFQGYILLLYGHLRPEPVSYSELHSLLLNHEFIHGSSMSSLAIPYFRRYT
ncbi:hypothetical protein KY290_036770 [Solanum tuberosum]|uniref:Uncharacterized protein n=1 Tax=Solanum tuberosum TaxID=4113 RepID=A0ABQ7TXG2_SOLTU|nr:hypothetical protein KY289_036253 [Solanum tuberosum]KAH0639504.1 hypothetical protein KY285_036090 [Solanum tuberosum]KAH0738065.1 hypothetical protein KY290_036770 [Solanum tuberosum]